MAKNLVIVESPAKAKTIKKFLGSNYEVIASNGHVRDLPKSQMGVAPEADFEPKYITIRGKGDLIAALRKEAKKADKVYLATDPDREGEAISWHLQQILKLDENSKNRITFNEITKNAVKNSIKAARRVDMDLVDAQQARRVLDRMVGYKISPLLWAKIKNGLSAGRVQSVALRIISDREKEIAAFIPEEYWSLDAVIESCDGKKNIKPLKVHFYREGENSVSLSDESETDAIIKKSGKKFVCAEVRESDKHRKAPLPFTTSTLQQEASKNLNFSTKKTMQLAQELYEGVEVKGHGTVGLITYLRTDSVRVSDEADKAVRAFIEENYGKDYVNSADVNKGTGKKIQDAHEAIRPTYLDIPLSAVKESLSRDLFRLYQLIWRRFVASRMSQAVYKSTRAVFDANGIKYVCNASKLSFNGYMSIYTTDEDNETVNDGDLSKLSKGDEFVLVQPEKEQHFTQAPAHFTEASLVKALEELGIGRPSTYAPTITTILARNYVTKEKKNIFVTELGEAVNTIMETSFPAIVDVNFTATMETLLDGVETGDIEWKTIVRNFYPDLVEAVEIAQKDLDKVKVRDVETDIVCEQCGRKMVIKYGPHGKFLACPGFPECKNTKQYNEKTEFKCPKCGGEVVIMKSRKGRRFFGCSNYPECDYMSWTKPEN